MNFVNSWRRLFLAFLAVNCLGSVGCAHRSGAGESAREPAGGESPGAPNAVICRQGWLSFLRGEKGTLISRVFKNEGGVQAFSTWSQTLASELGEAAITRSIALYYLDRLPPGAREKLFQENGKFISPVDFERRLNSLLPEQKVTIRGFNNSIVRLYEESVVYQGKNFEQGFQKINGWIETEIRSLSRAKLDDLRTEISKITALARTEKLLRDRRVGAYQMQIDRGDLKMPTGITYKIEKRNKDGSLIVSIPLERVMPETEYNLDALVRDYPNATSPDDFKAGLGGFKGELTPDGLFVFENFNQNGLAQSTAREGKIQVLIQMNNGGYSTLTHYQVLTQRNFWRAATKAEKDRLFSLTQSDEIIEAIRMIYNRILLPK